MRRGIRTGIAAVAVGLYLLGAHDRGSEGRVRPAGPAPKVAQAADPAPAVPPRAATQTAVTPQRALINQYCVTCHNDRVKTGGLSLADFNPEAADQHAEVAEKVIRKLRGGLMPPAGARGGADDCPSDRRVSASTRQKSAAQVAVPVRNPRVIVRAKSSPQGRARSIA